MTHTYTIGEFAKLSGTTIRTLRYYHERGLLHPTIDDSGYRHFTSADVDRLQLIQFFQQLGFSLADTAELLTLPADQQRTALAVQRERLVAERDALVNRIATVDQLLTDQEENNMTDTAKFAAMKQAALQENDAQFGTEVIAKYGASAKKASDQHFAGLSQADYERSEAIQTDLVIALTDALAVETPSADQLTRIYQDHRDWLKLMYPKYTPAYHRGIVGMYAVDQRFADYYNDKVQDKRAAALLTQAVEANLPE